jgi:hypothetical protein
MVDKDDGDLQSVDLLQSSCNEGNDLEGDDDDDDTVDPALERSSAAAPAPSRNIANTRDHGLSSFPSQPWARRISPAEAVSTGTNDSIADAYQYHAQRNRIHSPATQTLDALAQSQGSVDLHYDLSQLEYDVVAALVQTKKTRVVLEVDDNGSSGNLDDDEIRPKKQSLTVARGSKAAARLKVPEDSRVGAKKKKTTATTNRVSNPHVVVAAASSKSRSVPLRTSASNVSGRLPDRAKSKESLKTAASDLVSTSLLVRPLSIVGSAAEPHTPPPLKTALALASTNTDFATVSGKRGRLPESDRRDFFQISLRTGKSVRKFSSFSEAGKAVGFSRHIVAAILRGSYKTDHYKGWTFRFVDETPSPREDSKRAAKHNDADCYAKADAENDHEVRDEVPEMMQGSPDSMDSRRRKTYNRVEHIDLATGKSVGSYPSFVVAAEHTGVSRQKISAMVKGELDSFNGSTFRYEKDDPEGHAPDTLLSAKKEPRGASLPATSSRFRGLRQTSYQPDAETNVVTAEQEPTSSTSLVYVASNRSRTSKAAIAVEELDAATGKVVHTHRSLTLASEHSGANRHIISNVLKGRVESWKGKKWRYCATDVDNTDQAESDAEQHGDSRQLDEDRIEKRKRRAGPDESTGPTGLMFMVDTDGSAGMLQDVSAGKKIRRVSDEPTTPTGNAVSHAMDGTEDASNSKPPAKAADSAIEAGTSVAGNPSVAASSAERTESRTDLDVHSESAGCSMSCDYQIISAMLAQKGSMGMTVNRKRAPGALLCLLKEGHNLNESHVDAMHVYVGALESPSVASSAGIRLGDFIFFPRHADNSATPILHAEYNVVVEALKSETRPFTVLIARAKLPTSPPATKSSLGNGSVAPSSQSKGTKPSNLNDGQSSSADKSGSSKSKEGTSHSNGATGATASYGCPVVNVIVDAPARETSVVVGSRPKVTASATLCDVLAVGLVALEESSKASGKTPSISDIGQRSNTSCKHADLPCNVHRSDETSNDTRQKVPGLVSSGVTADQLDILRKQHIAKPEWPAMPFCNLCVCRSNRQVHHGWCPKHPDFETSGADAFIDHLLDGILMGCAVCKLEYSAGIRMDGNADKHVKNCPRAKCPRGKRKGRCKSTKKPKTKETKKRRKGDAKDAEVTCESPSTIRSNAGDDDNDSSYVIPSTSQGQRSKLILPKATEKLGEQMMCPGTNVYGAHSGSALISGIPPVLHSDEDDSDSGENVEVTWEVSGNPWGPDAHMSDDVVLFSSYPCFGHQETLFTAERYVVNPFKVSSPYRQTHMPPESGFQALVLQRDIMAVRPWGFTCHRHKDGGACLVFSVDPLSPAAAAVSCGGLDTIAPFRLFNRMPVVFCRYFSRF